MKNIVLVVLIFFTECSFAQLKYKFSNHKGIIVSYKLTKIDSSNRKKDTYLAEVSAENINDYDLFYLVEHNTCISIGSLLSEDNKEYFVIIDVKNARNLFGGIAMLEGKKSRLVHENGWLLYRIPLKSEIKQNFTFNISKGAFPFITESFNKQLYKISDLY